VQWLETIVIVEASAGFVLASMNCRHLLGYARVAKTAARRGGAAVMALVSGALSLEALVFLAWPAIETSPQLREATVVVVRSTLLLASAVVSVLLLRSGRTRV
jgi:hypothetical protein